MFSEHSNDDVSANDNNQLLRDIEAISNALYLNKPPLGSLPRTRSRSVEKSRISGSKNEPINDKRLWDWKKPLRALSHIGRHKFDCCFYLNVDSVEGLGSRFDGVSLCVNWKRKDQVLSTRAVKVVDGTAEFGERLMHRCCVYCSGNDKGVAKYGEKISIVFVSVVGMPGVDIGKHWVDLTRLLPLTLEELVGLRSFGKWTTTMKLTGLAEGAVLNVSLSFSVLKDNSTVPSSNMSFSQLLKLTQLSNSPVETGTSHDLKNSNGSLRRAGSIPSNMKLGSVVSARPVELKMPPEVLLGPRLELSKSINYLYQKLEERRECDLVKSEVLSGNVLPLKTDLNQDSGSVNVENQNEWEDIEFTIIEKGIELSDKDQLIADQGGGRNIDASADGKIVRDQINMDENGKDSTANDFIHASNLDKVVAEGEKEELNSACMNESHLEHEAHHRHYHTSTTLFGDFHTPSEFFEQEGYLDTKAIYKSSRMVKKSLSLDDVNKSVENNFFSFLGTENASSNLSSDGDCQSPREKLLREFEQEVLASGNLFFDFDANNGQEESGSTVLTTSSGSIDISDPFDFLSAFPNAERHEEIIHPLREKRKVLFLEDLETEDLMRKWGLNEEVFWSSPHYHSSGFGSPIELPPESPLKLPPLGEGLLPYVRTEDGGQLRSMNPRLFRNAKHGARLVMQVSRSVVLPAEMGSGFFEILQCLASIGVEALSLQMDKLMPLDDITSKILKQVQDAENGPFTTKQRIFAQHKSEVERDACSEREVNEAFLFSQSNGSLRAGSIGIDTDLEYVSLENLAPLAIDKIEFLSIEGLRIQSGFPKEDAPSSISSQPFQETSTFQGSPLYTVRESYTDVIELINLSLTLDEWLRLDAGNIDDRDKINEHALKILEAHHAKCFVNHGGGLREGKVWGNGVVKKHRMLPNYIMIVLRLQLRDPFRNFEPVGNPMLAFIHAERASVSMMPEIYSMADEVSQNEENSEEVVKTEMQDEKEMKYGNSVSKFKIKELHLAGLQTKSGNWQHWGTATHLQSGVRWLLASDLTKTSNYPFLMSKAIVRASQPIGLNLQPEDTLWSISSCNRGSSQLTPHIRNPDIIIPNGGTRFNTAGKYQI